MTIYTPLTLLLICCVALTASEQREWSWPCEPVSPQETVNMDQVVGRWFIVEGITAGLTKNENNCGVLDIMKTTDSSRLLFQYHTWLTYYGGRYYKIKNVFVTILSPSKWMAGGTPNLVVDQPAGGNTLAVSYCNEGQRTIIYSKSSATDLHGIHERLEKARVLGLQEAKPYNRTGCPSGDTLNSVYNTSRSCNFIDGYCNAGVDSLKAFRVSYLALLLPLLRLL